MSGFIVISSAIILFLYVSLVIVFITGWVRTPYFSVEKHKTAEQNISVVVACRNEEPNLKKLLEALQNQSVKNFELILVNDHSTDATRVIMDSEQSKLENVVIIDAEGFGKKQAVKQAVGIAKGKLIVTTDADCRPETTWIETIGQFQQKFPSDLIICPVKFSTGDTLFSKLQALEFATLVASGAGAAGATMPILCNGANLAFTKKAWLESQDDLHVEEMSGDDVFLLLAIKKRKGTIRFLKSANAFVSTPSSPTIKSFIRQRKRWASKSTAYSDWQIILTACAVFSISVLEIVSLLLMFFNGKFAVLFMILFITKYLTDLFFLSYVRYFFNLRNLGINSFILSLFYPFYIVMVALAGLGGKTHWK